MTSPPSPSRSCRKRNEHNQCHWVVIHLFLRHDLRASLSNNRILGCWCCRSTLEPSNQTICRCSHCHHCCCCCCCCCCGVCAFFWVSDPLLSIAHSALLLRSDCIHKNHGHDRSVRRKPPFRCTLEACTGDSCRVAGPTVRRFFWHTSGHSNRARCWFDSHNTLLCCNWKKHKLVGLVHPPHQRKRRPLSRCFRFPGSQ